MEAAARSSQRVVRRKRAKSSAAGHIDIPAAASSSSTKRPRRTVACAAAQIDIPAASISAETEAAARSASHICRAKPPARRRRTAQFPSRRARARKKTLRPHPPRPDPNCGGKPEHSELLSLTRSNLDTERARIDLHCPPDSFHVDLPRPSDNNNWRDWANLDDGPVGLIAERVLAYDVADYVRFRAVCRPWRQCSSEPRAHSGLDRRFHPWRWTMLREEHPALDRRSFLNTSTGECVQVDIPELRDYELLSLTPEGLLVLLHKQPLTSVRLLNPLTRHLTELPPLTTLLPSKDHHMILDRDPDFSKEFAAWGSGIAYDDSTVVLCFDTLCMLGMAKPGDDHWTLLNYNDYGTITAALMFGGRFYCVNLNDGIMVLETSPDQPPRLEVAACLNIHVSSFAHSVHLVNNFGELILVHRRGAALTARNKSGWRYDAYRVHLDTGTLSPVKSLGGNAVFMGMRCSLSVSPEVFPSGSISADTIYLSFDVGERWLLKVGAYHLTDGSIERTSRYCRGLVPSPHTLVDCLSFSNTV